MRYRVKFSDRKRGAFVEARNPEAAVQAAAGERFISATLTGSRQWSDGTVDRRFFRVVVMNGATVARMATAHIEATVEEAPL